MAYSYVNNYQNSANSNVTTISPTAGNTLILISSTSTGAGNPTLTQVQDSGSNLWTQGIATYQDSNGNWNSMYYTSNAAALLTSVTCTYNGGTPGSCGIIVIQYSGLATASGLITTAKNSQAAPGTTANAITSGSTLVTLPGGAPAAAIIGVVLNSGDSDTTNGTGFTARYGTGVSNLYFIEDQRITSSTTLAATATAPTHGGTDSYATFLLAFSEPAVASINLMGQICL